MYLTSTQSHPWEWVSRRSQRSSCIHSAHPSVSMSIHSSIWHVFASRLEQTSPSCTHGHTWGCRQVNWTGNKRAKSSSTAAVISHSGYPGCWPHPEQRQLMSRTRGSGWQRGYFRVWLSSFRWNFCGWLQSSSQWLCLLASAASLEAGVSFIGVVFCAWNNGVCGGW